MISGNLVTNLCKVYLMKWRKRICAEKQLLDQNFSEERYEEFKKEALLMINLKHHPNVVTVTSP